MGFADDVTAAVTPTKKPTNWRPYHPGAIVTGHNWMGLFGIIDHKGHLFQVGKAVPMAKPPKGWTNSGWKQPATCIVCGTDITPVDAEWWYRKATKEDILRVMNTIVETRIQLKRAWSELRELI